MRLDPFYIWVEEEGEGEKAEAEEHELRLLAEYKAREALQQVESGGKRDKKVSAGLGCISWTLLSRSR